MALTKTSMSLFQYILRTYKLNTLSFKRIICSVITNYFHPVFLFVSLLRPCYLFYFRYFRSYFIPGLFKSSSFLINLFDFSGSSRWVVQVLLTSCIRYSRPYQLDFLPSQTGVHWCRLSL